MFSKEQEAEYLGQLNAFLHAQVDGRIALISARHKETEEEVILACVVQQIEVPSLVLGVPPQFGERIVPIFQFVNPHAANPYESLDPELRELERAEIPDANTIKA